MAPAHPMVPLVLQSEYSDSLQGAYSVEDIMDLARDAGVTDARFEPVCMGQRTGFFPATVLRRLPCVGLRRVSRPPHAAFPGSTPAPFPYDPSLVRPILAVAATDQHFTHLWPVAFSAASDCESALEVD